MKFYTSAVQWGNNILFRGVENGVKVQEKVPFAPTLFVKSKKDTKFHSVFGDPIEPIKFGDINDAKDYIKRYADVDGFPVFGNTNFAYQFISETFPAEIDFNMADIKIDSLDIETTAEDGFPDVRNPVEEILLISLQDYNTKEIVTYGSRPYTADGTEYIQCANERELLMRFLHDFQRHLPDVITGWNIEFFDIPYLVARITKLFGEATARKLSPWNLLREKEVTRNGRSDLQYEIVGISTLDYLNLYKKFTYNAQESYKLDHIAYVELGERKLENPYDTFKEFYTKDWEGFVRYNIRDVQLIDRLEMKMRLIELIILMALDAKSNFNDIFSAVRTWDCILYNALLQMNVIVHQKSSGVSGSIVGGYVKEPIPGKYKWVVSVDATSLYPSIMMQWNMSPETLMQDFVKVTVQQMIDKTADIDYGYAVAANGHMFNTDKQGFFAKVVQKLFDDRQRYKKLMLQATKDYERTHDNKFKNDISKYNNYQMARKIQLNSLFGACANEYFRFYDNRIAEGITTTGQFIIQYVSKAVNEYLNKICQTEGVEYAFYADTDSVYITFDNLVEKFYKNKTTNEIVDLLDKIVEDKVNKIIDKACKEIFDYTHAFEEKIFFKREAIADGGIWVAKKRYALNVYDNEGVRYTEPKLKVMGLEIVRSSTPEVIRKSLKEGVRIALQGSEQELQDFIIVEKEKFMKLVVDDISFPRSVNGMTKYASASDIYTKGTPMHVRGSLMYNHLLKKLNITKKYEAIKEGDKIKFVYLKEPNHIHENCIAFVTHLPKEFEMEKLIDYELMFEKTFIDPLATILNCIGWHTQPVASLEDLFS